MNPLRFQPVGTYPILQREWDHDRVLALRTDRRAPALAHPIWERMIARVLATPVVELGPVVHCVEGDEETEARRIGSGLFQPRYAAFCEERFPSAAWRVDRDMLVGTVEGMPVVALMGLRMPRALVDIDQVVYDVHTEAVDAGECHADECVEQAVILRRVNERRPMPSPPISMRVLERSFLRLVDDGDLRWCDGKTQAP